MILWKAWQLRNNVIHGDGKETVSGAVHQLLRLGDDLEMATLASDKRGSKSTLSVHVQSICKIVTPAWNWWRTPPEGIAKLNFDAAFLQETKMTWGGAVVWEFSGNPLLSVGRQLQQCMSIEEAEASTVLMGLSELKKNFHGAFTNWDRLWLHSTRASIGRNVQIVVVCCDDRY